MEEKQSIVKIWAAQTRANFLILAVLLVCIGLSMAAVALKGTGKSFDPVHAVLLVAGVVLAHASVNLFNEYSDYRTGIDSNTERTPFSGGSGKMQAGLTKPGAVLAAAIGTLLAALAVGVYFCVTTHWVLIPIIALGGIAIVFYTGWFARWLLGEFFAGLTLGSFVVIGTFIAMTGTSEMTPYEALPFHVILTALPPGILTSLLLFLNEFPDADADRKGGRFHLVIWLGKKKASRVYVVCLAFVYIAIAAVPVMYSNAVWALIGLLTVPVAAKAAFIALRDYNDNGKLVTALGMNVIVVLVTDALLAIAFFIVWF